MQTEDVIPVDELIASGAELIDGHGKATAVIRSSLAIVSLISSSILILMLLRSKVRLSTTYHRLLLGLSIANIFFSSGLAHFNSTAPSDVDYFVWNARGNQATCSAQGFILFVGSGSSVFYSCSLNLYYLAVVKYQKREKYVRTKVEPFLHGFPVLYALVCSITMLVKQNINDGGGGSCNNPVYQPPHCDGYEDGQIREGFEIPCGRGRDGAVLFYYLIAFTTYFIVPLIIIVSLGMIYRAVLQQEKKIAKYGANALTAGTQQSGAGDAYERVNRGSLMDRSFAFVRRSAGSSNSNKNQSSYSRVVLHRAFAYSSAFFLAWSFFIIGACFDIANMEWPTAIWYLTNIFNPLQGLFNFMIFMYPKVTSAKYKGNNISWCQAFAEAFWPREKNDRSTAGKTRGRPERSKTQPVSMSGGIDHTSGNDGGQPKKNRAQPMSPEAEGEEPVTQVTQTISHTHELSVSSRHETDTFNHNSAPNHPALNSGVEIDSDHGKQRRLQMQQIVRESEHFFKTALQE